MTVRPLIFQRSHCIFYIITLKILYIIHDDAIRKDPAGNTGRLPCRGQGPPRPRGPANREEHPLPHAAPRGVPHDRPAGAVRACPPVQGSGGADPDPARPRLKDPARLRRRDPARPGSLGRDPARPGPASRPLLLHPDGVLGPPAPALGGQPPARAGAPPPSLPGLPLGAGRRALRRPAPLPLEAPGAPLPGASHGGPARPGIPSRPTPRPTSRRRF
jgi:hypothetical protein